MTNLPENFCIAPFVQHTTHPTGSFSPCPYLGGTVWPGGSHKSIVEQWRSQGLQDLRQSFIKNQKNPICKRCWDEEQHGKRSLRLRLYDPKNHTSDYQFTQQINWYDNLVTCLGSKDYLKGPQVLSIKNGNICNARCRTCYPQCSSRWIPDAKKLVQLIPNESIYATNVRENNWSDQQIEELVLLGKNLVRLELFGGEPTFNKRVKELLHRLVDAGYSKHITLYINTNGGVDILDVIPEVLDFQFLEIGVSIDGIGPHFNYIRNGLEYDKVIGNVQRWRQQLENKPAFIDCITTVNILNIYYLPEIKKVISGILSLPPFWNLLVEPGYLYIKNIPMDIKKLVINKLSQDQEEFNDLINLLNQEGDPIQWGNFLTYTQSIDSIRGENFNNTFLEFSSLINQSSNQ